MEYSGMRKELIEYLEGLSDRTYQYDCWVNNNCPEGVEHDELDYAVHFLFDDTDLASNPDRHIGEILKDDNEAALVKAVCDIISRIFDIYGYDRSDEEYIKCNEWSSVLDAAKKALNAIN